jgi:hypothetical protein
MKRTIDYYDFVDEFNRYDRGEQFSRDGLNQLFNYMEEVNSEYDLDVIALCCDFSQCSLREFLDAFPSVEEELEPIRDSEEIREAISNYIEKNGFWFAFVENGQEVIFENF